MSMEGRIELTIKFWTDSVGKDVSLSREKDIQTASYEEQAGARIRLAGAATVAVDMTHLTEGTMLYVEVSKADVLVKLGVSEHQVALHPSTGQKARMLIDGGSLTSMKFTNESANTEAEILWFVAGV